jgi:hypothetical protein
MYIYIKVFVFFCSEVAPRYLDLASDPVLGP